MHCLSGLLIVIIGKLEYAKQNLATSKMSLLRGISVVSHAIPFHNSGWSVFNRFCSVHPSFKCLLLVTGDTSSSKVELKTLF